MDNCAELIARLTILDAERLPSNAQVKTALVRSGSEVEPSPMTAFWTSMALVDFLASSLSFPYCSSEPAAPTQQKTEHLKFGSTDSGLRKKFSNCWHPSRWICSSPSAQRYQIKSERSLPVSGDSPFCGIQPKASKTGRNIDRANVRKPARSFSPSSRSMVLNTLQMAPETMTDWSPCKLVNNFSKADPSVCPISTVDQQSVTSVKRSSSESFGAIALKAPRSEGL